MQEVIYDCRWSTDLDDSFKTDFCRVEDSVFHNNYSEKRLLHKYIHNIYGPSVLVVVYIDGVPSAARALWRNDIYGKEAYQPSDTCVMKECRGKGIFTEMTKRSIALLPESAIIYNFPNHLSYQGYIKMGWNLVHEYGARLFSRKRYFKEHPIKMDKEYAKWWVIGRRDISYLKSGQDFFLVKPDRRPFINHIIACVDEGIAKSFPSSSWGLYFYQSGINTFYNHRFMKSHVVSRSLEVKYIPTWKIDAL